MEKEGETGGNRKLGEGGKRGGREKEKREVARLRGSRETCESEREEKSQCPYTTTLK